MTKIINCIGDSVTEGMATEGHHTAEYGKSPYPARLYTLLKDEGYDVIVNNYGHGGERLPEIAARSGAIACYTSEDIIVPHGVEVSLGKYSAEYGKVENTKLKLCYSDETEKDVCVYFTQESHDTNPVYIDGKKYNLHIKDDSENIIENFDKDSDDTFIPKGSLVFTSNFRASDVNVFYGGINDGAAMSLTKYIDILKACANANGGRYIVLGSTHSIWNKWKCFEGLSDSEKYDRYKRACLEAFGVHFIDMYDEFSRHAVDIAIGYGYFDDKNDEEIHIMREKFANHTVPAEFTYNKESENDVHLSEEGYQVIAKLVSDRMKLLGYI